MSTLNLSQSEIQHIPDSKEKALEQFLEFYPAYKETSALDDAREKDFSRLDEQSHTYLDFTGGNLYPASLIQGHADYLKQAVLGNPHSTNPASAQATQGVEITRKHILDYFNASDDYFCIFTANCSAGLKIIGESYPFSQDAHLMLTLDNHNSVNGIREFAKMKGATFSYTPLDPNSLRIDSAVLTEKLDQFGEKTNKLLAFPAQSNVSGIKHDLDFIEIAKSKGWHVLLDTAAFVPTDKLDLSKVKPDFATVSFYKMFGYPTGIGCLLMRKDVFPVMKKPWYAGGTVAIAAATYDGHLLMGNHERFEDGTLSYLEIPAVYAGLNYLSDLGIDKIKTRISSLSQWLIHALQGLKHHNGRPLVKILGDTRAEMRGGTVSMHFYDQNGQAIPFLSIEQEANQKTISLRTGCFCNPGIDEVSNNINQDQLSTYFNLTDKNMKPGETCLITQMTQKMGVLRGSVRVSVGFISNFNDVFRFYKFAASFLNR
ncbi:MAG: aminotransferase class V-fold PLP-dependent enzyme [Balneolales bacterium]|nr:aminotransferase class V-fold PLP-dependent enzyme [Balneolales bacterium]